MNIKIKDIVKYKCFKDLGIRTGEVRVIINVVDSVNKNEIGKTLYSIMDINSLYTVTIEENDILSVNEED